MDEQVTHSLDGLCQLSSCSPIITDLVKENKKIKKEVDCWYKPAIG